MCVEPATMMMAFSIGTGILDFVGGRQDASNQNASIWNNYNQQIQDLNAQADEINTQANDDKSELAIDSMRERARVRAASGEAIGMGNTASMLLADVYAQEGRQVTKIELNRQSRLEQNKRQAQSLYANASSQSAGIESPSLLGLGLSIGGAVAERESKRPSRPKLNSVQTT